MLGKDLLWDEPPAVGFVGRFSVVQMMVEDSVHERKKEGEQAEKSARPITNQNRPPQPQVKIGARTKTESA